MSKYLYDAALLQLRGKALEAYASLDLLFKNPTAMPDHSAWVAEIIKHTQALAQNENTMITLQQHFGKHFSVQQPVVPEPSPAHMGPATPVGPDEPPSEPRVITPEMSSTLKQHLKRQKMIEAGKVRRTQMAKKELYPDVEEKSGLKEASSRKRRSRKDPLKAEKKSSDVE